MTAKELTQRIKANESADGRASQFEVRQGCLIVIESEYIRGTGPHRAWKRLYYLQFEGLPKFGGYDRRDSFVRWASRKMAERAMWLP